MHKLIGVKSLIVKTIVIYYLNVFKN
jgi:hypothetical protein